MSVKGREANLSGSNQEYIVSQTSDGHFRIIRSNRGLAVEVPGFSTSNGTGSISGARMVEPTRSGALMRHRQHWQKLRRRHLLPDV
jgi:hypothetical protein